MQGDGEDIEGNILMTAGVRWGERARKIKTERQAEHTRSQCWLSKLLRNIFVTHAGSQQPASQ